MKNILIGLSFLTLTVNAFAFSPQDIYENSVTTILYLKNQDDKESWSGTGFFVKIENDLFLITNNHIVQDPNVEPQKEAKDIDVSKMIGFSKNYKPNDKPYSGFRLLYTDPVADIAILKVSNIHDGDKWLELADSEEKIIVGDDCFWIGNPGGLGHFTFSRGYLGKINTNGDSFELQMHGVGFHGSSGSPFLNKDGKVIGILATGNDRKEEIILESHGEKIKLNQIKAHEGVVFGSSLESISKALNKALSQNSSSTISESQIINDESSSVASTKNLDSNESSSVVSTKNLDSNESKNDLDSLIRELKAYTPPEERKLGSL